MRSTSPSIHPERSPIPEPRADTHHRSASTGSSLKALMSSNDSYAPYHAKIDCDMNSKHDLPVVVDKHLDVREDEGWITIPCKELFEKWNHVPDIQSLCSLDRSFLFPGEQAHILACLSACKQDTQLTPFKVAALTDTNGISHNPEEENGNIERNNSVFGEGELSTSGEEKLADISDGEPFLQMEVLLQVNVGVSFLKDPCIEILQFEKSQERIQSSDSKVDAVYTNQDPYAELLNWILPLENGKPPIRPISPSRFTTNSGIGSTSQRSNLSSSSGSQLFSLGNSLGNFRSYSMSSLPQTTIAPTAPVKAASSKPSFDLEDWDQIPSQKFLWKKIRVEELLSFRGVSFERDRFSVCCGLEGIYAPGRKWSRKVEIIQPVEIHSFASNFNSEDLLCVQIKNVAPAHAPNIVIFIDAINIVFVEPTNNGTLSSLPISCVEAGNDHSLPNLALRRGEEHSFILKPSTSTLKVQNDRNSQLSKLQYGNKTSKLSRDQYAIMVACRSNYTVSRLFFKQPTSWRPHISRDIKISVQSKMSRQSPGAYGKIALPILTLQASNLTSEDLSLTVLAPASFTPPSVVSLNSPMTPTSPFIGFTEFLGRVNGERGIGATSGQSFTSIIKENEKHSYDGETQAISTCDDIIPSSGLSCTHLWLQSRVPLGCIPSQSIATIKLELLPLTDGIITLDSLQIDVKEKGVTYIPECSLKINATSSISKELM
ncbi:plant/MEB5-like protein [Sesbania bispinosa]|nr:plant/MEB5-like protein [Sesbania bispinosa]